MPNNYTDDNPEDSSEYPEWSDQRAPHHSERARSSSRTNQRSSRSSRDDGYDENDRHQRQSSSRYASDDDDDDTEDSEDSEDSEEYSRYEDNRHSSRYEDREDDDGHSSPRSRSDWREERPSSGNASPRANRSRSSHQWGDDDSGYGSSATPETSRYDEKRGSRDYNNRGGSRHSGSGGSRGSISPRNTRSDDGDAGYASYDDDEYGAAENHASRGTYGPPPWSQPSQESRSNRRRSSYSTSDGSRSNSSGSRRPSSAGSGGNSGSSYPSPPNPANSSGSRSRPLHTSGPSGQSGQSGYSGASGAYGQRAAASRYGAVGPSGQNSTYPQNRQMSRNGMSQPAEQRSSYAPSYAPMLSTADIPPTSSPQRKSRRTLWVVLSVVTVVILLAVGGAGYVIFQTAAPAATAAAFCIDLQAGSYPSAYALFDANMQQQLTADQFATAAQTLNTAEGTIQSCAGASGPNSYSYHLGASGATALMNVVRVNVGPTQRFQGAIHLKNVGGWKVDALDTAFFGVNLGALQVVNSYCTAMQNQNYQTAYATLGSAFTKTSASDFAQMAQLQDQVDGKVNYCQVSGLGSSNTDSASNLTLTLKRDALGQKQDTFSLDVESNAWKISAIGPQLHGTDLGAYQVVLRFCSDLSKASYKDIYGLFSAHFLAGASEALVAETFSGQIILPPNTFYARWDGCTAQPSTYKVSGTSASITLSVRLTRLDTGQTATGPVVFQLVKNGSNWQIDNFGSGKA